MRKENPLIPLYRLITIWASRKHNQFQIFFFFFFWTAKLSRPASTSPPLPKQTGILLPHPRGKPLGNLFNLHGKPSPTLGVEPGITGSTLHRVYQPSHKGRWLFLFLIMVWIYIFSLGFCGKKISYIYISGWLRICTLMDTYMYLEKYIYVSGLVHICTFNIYVSGFDTHMDIDTLED